MLAPQFEANDLHSRRNGIGGSDASAILGFNRYKSPLGVYLEKVGEPLPIEDNARMEWGVRLEATIAEAYGDKRKVHVKKVDQTDYHPDYPWMYGHYDYVGPDGFIEIKASFSPKLWGEPGTDEVPEQYICQCQHYMAINGQKSMDLAVLINGHDFRVYTIPRDEDFIALMIQKEQTFWQDHVLKLTPPQAACADDLAYLYPNGDQGSVFADSSMMFTLAALRGTKTKIKELQEAEDNLIYQIKMAMSDHDILLDQDGQKLCTWKKMKSDRFNQKSFQETHPDLYDQFKRATEVRVFRVF